MLFPRVGDPDQTAQKLAPYLSLPTSELASKLRSDSQQSVWLAQVGPHNSTSDP